MNAGGIKARARRLKSAANSTVNGEAGSEARKTWGEFAVGHEGAKAG